jgi:hypothetical protein
MRRLFLYVLIASVLLSAVMGIVALLSETLGETEIKVLMSTLCVAGASILAMACAAAWEKGRARRFAGPGMVLSILGFGLFLFLIWKEFESDSQAKTSVTLIIAATFCAHAALLLLLRVADRFRRVQSATIVMTALLGGLLVWMLWAPQELADTWRILGILGILGTAGTILTAVFHRMSRDELKSEATSAARCPQCGEALSRAFLETALREHLVDGEA